MEESFEALEGIPTKSRSYPGESSFQTTRHRSGGQLWWLLVFVTASFCVLISRQVYRGRVDPIQSVSSSVNPSSTWNNRAGFLPALEHVISLLPNTSQRQHLLQDFTSSGKAKILDVGLRARAYSTFFSAWEDLHLVNDGAGGLYPREDVIQQLRRLHTSQLLPDSARPLHQTIHLYEAYRTFLARLAYLLFPWTTQFLPNHMALHTQIQRGSRGIILTAGDSQAELLLTMIPTLRAMGCTLPVEVLYFGEQDLGADYRAALEAFDGVVTRDFSPMIGDEEEPGEWEPWARVSDGLGWASKVFAVLFSSFKECLFIDADAFFFRDPEFLFEDSAYREHGALFFFDRMMFTASKRELVRDVLPPLPSGKVKSNRLLTGESSHMQESGVVVIDKWRHFMALLLLARLNGPDRLANEEGELGVYDFFHGDKETWWLAWELIGNAGYAFHPGGVGVIGSVEEEYTDEHLSFQAQEQDRPQVPYQGREQTQYSHKICSQQLLHLDARGRPLWFNGGLLKTRGVLRKDREFTKFEAYVREPKHSGESGAWKFHGIDTFCLHADEVSALRAEELQVIEMLRDTGEKIGILREENAIKVPSQHDYSRK